MKVCHFCCIFTGNFDLTIQMKKVILIFVLISCCFDIRSQALILSDSSHIGLLTCEPGEEVYALYGHTALRVSDEVNRIDFTFNYGVFDFDTPNFIYRFTKGETDYILGVTETARFLEQYKNRGSGVVEQILNLTQEEKQTLWVALLENSLPENREYRYNFLYDNCSTRPRILIENSVSGKVEYAQVLEETTFRKMIRYCNRNYRWLAFGIDLILGAPIDKPIGQEPQLFLPGRLMTVFASAKVVTPDGNSRNLVSDTKQRVPEFPIDDKPRDSNPLVICWLFFGVILITSAIEIRKRKYFRWLDAVLFLTVGAVGCLLTFMMFISEHPGTFPNYSFIWAHPLHLVFVLCLIIRPLRRFVVYYAGVNSVILLLFMCCWKLFPQEFNPAFLPIVLTLYLRSISYAVVQTKLFADKINK